MALRSDKRCMRLLVTVALGTAAFSMQDVLLEPYGGEILGLSVAGTTLLNALVAAGTLGGFAIAARRLDANVDPLRLASAGLLIGIVAFSAVVFASPMRSTGLFRCGALLIGLGTGLFSVGTLTAALELVRDGKGGRVLGAWGTVYACAAGLAIAFSGFIRDGIGALATAGTLGPAMNSAVSGYMVVYHIEIGLLFAGLVAIGPLVGRRHTTPETSGSTSGFGLAQYPS
jgi:BCD family chlorophyll transporter-like MFS transporter